MFEFDLRLAEADRQGYYITRWDRAKPITVQATDLKSAASKAAKAMSEPRSGFYWTYTCDAIREVPEPVTA